MSKKWKTSLVLPFFAAAVMAGAGIGSTRAQEADPALSPSAESNVSQQQVLASALARLNDTAPKLDAATQKMLPDIRAIITRVVLHPETATPTETAIADDFIAHTRGLWDEVAAVNTANTLQVQVQQTASVPIQFVPETDQVPGGQPKGVVLLKNPNDQTQTTLVEIPVGTKDYPVDKRAQLVANRLQAARQSDPLFASALTAYPYNNEIVVGPTPGSSDYLITADKQFAELSGLTPQQLATNIETTIQAKVDPNAAPNTRALWSDFQLSPDQKLARANGLRQSGDDAYNEGDKDGAERLYLHAVRLAPEYAEPYIRLSDLYIEEGQYDKSVDILQQAQASATLTGDQKAKVAADLTLAQSKLTETTSKN
jgi:hypothetical protein